ncbi:hypothetical protein K8Q93_02130 [Candidatus Parcubacteria bacterium]|nr:hypothetical protein [Candidatus Parcubacteria bacterium]
MAAKSLALLAEKHTLVEKRVVNSGWFVGARENDTLTLSYRLSVWISIQRNGLRWTVSWRCGTPDGSTSIAGTAVMTTDKVRSLFQETRILFPSPNLSRGKRRAIPLPKGVRATIKKFLPRG